MKTSKRGKGALAAIAVALAILAGPFGAHAALGKFCDDPTPISGFGTPSQFRLHYEVFVPALESKCPKAIGMVNYLSGDDATTYTRATLRGPDVSSGDHDAFWAKDVPFTTAEAAAIEGDTGGLIGRVSTLGHFPIYIEGLAVAYNLSCWKKPLNLSTLNLSLIYQGTITSWSDTRLAAQNTGLDTACVGKSIKLTARADAAGQTGVFKSLLARRNPVWIAYEQPQLNTAWPTTATIVCRGGGDRGAAGCVSGNSGSIGYVTIQRSLKQRLKTANIERVHFDTTAPGVPSMDYVAPSIAGCTKAAASLVFPPGFDSYSDWSQISLVDSTAGYPLCYFSYVMALQLQGTAYKDGISPGGSGLLRDYLILMVDPSVQKIIASRGYAPLPGNIVQMDKAGIANITRCSLPTRAYQTPVGDDRDGHCQVVVVPHTQ